MSTLFFEDSGLEIHKVVVGPMDNNVFVLRCTETGEGALIDAANEHERLLDLCKNLGVKQVLETCLLYTSPSPRDLSTSRMPSSA